MVYVVDSTKIDTYLPNLDELLFLTVFAFPNASIMGLQNNIYYSIALPPTLFSFDLIELDIEILTLF